MQTCFRLIGRFEGLSFLVLLLIAMPCKYYLNQPLGVRVMGPVHGFLFLAYCACATWCAIEKQWSGTQHLLAYLAAVVPGGTFWFEKVYLRTLKKA